MELPTWKSVSVPANVVQHVMSMKPSFQMDCLVSQVVFHNFKKLSVTYCCDRCGFQYQPNRTTEEVCSCQGCGLKQVRCFQSLKLPQDRKIPYYSRSSRFLTQVIAQMNKNFQIYFQAPPERDMDWEWHAGYFYVSFAGGGTAQDIFPKVAISKAAILTPYLWDTRFDWKEGKRCDEIDQKFISHIFNQLTPIKDQM